MSSFNEISISAIRHKDEFHLLSVDTSSLSFNHLLVSYPAAGIRQGWQDVMFFFYNFFFFLSFEIPGQWLYYRHKIAMRKIDSKRRQFQVAIRRKHIEQTFNQLRKMNDNDLCCPHDLAEHMHLPNTQQPYTMSQLLRLKEKSIMAPALGDMQEETEATLPLDLHIKFWKIYSEQMARGESHYEQLIGEVLMKLIARCDYCEIHENTAYQLHLLNMLQMCAPSMPLPFRKAVLEWVAGPEGLRVIDACLEDKALGFLKPSNYRQLYRVIEAGLKSELKAESEDAAGVLISLLLNADWDDCFELYYHCHGLMNYLCAKIERYWQSESITKFNKAAMFLLDTYDEAIVDYARAGLAYAAALLVTSSLRENYTDGLEMLRMITQIDDNRNVSYLLDSNEIAQIGLWRRLCQEDGLSRNENREVREHYQATIHHILALGEQHQIASFCKHFQDRYEDIIQMFVEELDNNEEDIPIVCLILQSMLSLVYYGREEKREHALLEVCQKRRIIPQLERFSKNKEGDIAESARSVLDTLFYMEQE